MNSVEMSDSTLKTPPYAGFDDAFMAVNEDNVRKLVELYESKKEKIKNYIIERSTSKFDLDANFFRKKRVTYTIPHNSICFAIIIFHLRNNLKLSYKNICRILKIREKNSVTFYMRKLNSLKDTNEDDLYYINLKNEIAADIKNFVEQTIKNHNTNGTEA